MAAPLGSSHFKKGLRLFLLDDYFTLIGAAICAYTVREVILATLGALDLMHTDTILLIQIFMA